MRDEKREEPSSDEIKYLSQIVWLKGMLGMVYSSAIQPDGAQDLFWGFWSCFGPKYMFPQIFELIEAFPNLDELLLKADSLLESK